VTLEDGKKEIAPRKYLPINMIFDHRALDYGDMVPFMQRLDEIFANPACIRDWM
jgi:pyruvate dehydrogenase E2 component (dihydrolipoamide acetyltransferase)